LPEREVMTGIGPVASANRVYAIARRTLPTPTASGSLRRAALHAAIEVDRGAADPLSEGDIDRRLLRGAGGAARQGCCRVVSIGDRPPEDGWFDEHAAWQKRDLSAKRYVYIWADGIHLEARLEDEKQCILVLIGATPEGRSPMAPARAHTIGAICCLI
jgi:hypothetical protein